MYVFDTDLYSYLFLEPDGRLVSTGLENLDIQDSESPKKKKKKILSPWPFTTIKWTLLLGRNFCNETHDWVSLGMVSSIIIPNNCYHLQCSFTALSHLGRILSSWRSLSSNGGYYRSIYFPFLGSLKIL